MKYKLKTIWYRRMGCRGSALIMAILVTMLLFIVGMAFLSEMITDKASVARIDEDAILDNAVDTVVEKINSVLVSDLFGTGGFLAGNAAYDYPGGVNYWLASLEPEVITIPDINGNPVIVDIDSDGFFPDYYWPHITDLWGKWFMSGYPKFNCYYDPLPGFRDVIDSDPMMTNPTSYYHLAWDYLKNPYADWNIVSGNPRIVCRIVPSDEPIRDAILNCMDNAPWWDGQYPYNNSYVESNFLTDLLSFRGITLSNMPKWDPRLPAPVPYDGPFPTIFDGRGLTRADADGDGVADSRWVQLYRIDQDGPYDYAIYAAVRIIDNGGMININTALRDPAIAAPPLLPASNSRDGSLLTHINMDRHPIFYEPANKGIIAFSEPANTSALHAARIGGMGWTEIEYNNYVAMRLLNPVPGATPFDLTDELELRNRLLMTSSVIPRSAWVWPVTFDPPLGAVGVALPYTDTFQLANWFDKMTPYMNHPLWVWGNPIIVNYNRRHLVTTYNFDRTSHRGTNDIFTTPSIYPFDPLMGRFIDVGPRKVGISLPNNGLATALLPYSGFADLESKNLYIDQLAGAIYRGLPNNNDIQNRFGPDYTRETISWQYAVNLVDYQDFEPAIDPEPTTHRRITLPDANYVDVFGVESDDLLPDSLFISEVGFYEELIGQAGVPVGKYYAVELFNPNPATITKSLDDYMLRIGKDSKKVDIPLSLITDNNLNPLEERGAANNRDTVVLIHGEDNSGGIDEVSIIFSNIFNVDTNRIFYLKDEKLVFDPIDPDLDQLIILKMNHPSGAPMPVDCIKAPVGTDFFGVTERRTEMTDGTGNTFLLLSNIWDSTSPILGVAPTIASQVKMQYANFNLPLKTIGEIEKVFSVGFSYNSRTGVYHTLTEAVGVAYEIDTSDEEINIAGSELRSWGRIDLSDSDYWSLLDYLTYFDPAADNIIDNDGNPYTSGNPFTDGIDNNGDGVLFDDPIGDPDEGLPYFYEQAVPGRININTAPWFVIAQLPWITPELAHAIVAYRDKTNLGLKIPGAPDYSHPTLGRTLATHNPLATAPDPNIYSEYPGFRHIGQLMEVRVHNTSANPQFDIRQYMLDEEASPPAPPGTPLNTGIPDFSGDAITDDFEERDLIFQRISNLVTVRSDVFTAYILVRIGRAGPEKRMIAIFDRSNCFLPGDTPKLVALHPVPDPR